MSRNYLPEFNATEFHKLHNEMKIALNQLSGKKVIAILGMTGSGKSTTLNYLTGARMEKIKNLLTTTYEVADSTEKTATIGHEGSQTLLPEAYPVAGYDDLLLLDTAGLGDTRGKNVSLCISLGLQEISEVAHIQGVVIVLRQAAITEPRGKGLRELFQLVSQLTASRLVPSNVIFCVTGVQCSDDSNNEVVIHSLLENVRKTVNTLTTELNTADEKIKTEMNETIAALSLMNSDNLFLMRALDDREKQQHTRQQFFSYVKNMTGLTEGLSMAVDDATHAQLALWSHTVAEQGVSDLTRLKNIAQQQEAITKNVKQVSVLHTALSDLFHHSQKVASVIQHIDQTKTEKTREKTALLSKKEEIQSEAHYTAVPMPKNNSGVGGLVSFSQQKTLEKNADHLVVCDHTYITANKANVVSFVVSREVNDQETSAKMIAGIDAQSRLENTEDYKKSLQKMTHTIASLELRYDKLKKEKQTNDDKITGLKQEIVAIASKLKISISAENSVEEILHQLTAWITTNQTQFNALSKQKAEINSAIASRIENYRFLCDIASPAQLNDPLVQQLVQLYKTHCASVVKETHVVSLASSTQALFGVVKQGRLSADRSLDLRGNACF